MARVFISSTNLDLEDCRLEAAMAAHAANFNADLQENWTAEDHPPLDACLERVRQADVLVVILAHRYGWVPEEAERNPESKSITWLECKEAVAHGKQVLAFVVDEGADWADDLKDEADLKRAGALADPEAATKLFMETHNRINGLKAFKQWLGARGLRRTFRTKEELKLEVERALQQWRSRKAAEGAGAQAQNAGPPPVPFAYLAWLRRECESVELLGLEAQELHPTRLSQVYVPAVTPTQRPKEDLANTYRAQVRDDRPQHDLLLSRLGAESLYVPGDPGAGKSTFCRWLALVAASEALPAHPIADPEGYHETYPDPLRDRLPVLVPLRELWQSLPLKPGVQHFRGEALVTALGRWLTERVGSERIHGGTFAALLQAGRALLILGGVDEIPVADGDTNRRTYPRACLLAALADGQKAWTRAGNRMLITSRPYGLRQEDIQRLGLPEAALAPLEEELQSLFIRRWYAAADPDRAEEKARGLNDHLAARPDLAELKRNPMLLTALCVRYGEGRRLPQDRHDLYDKIVNNVLFNRYRGEDHERAAVRGRLAAIALGMHTGASIQMQRTTPEAAVSLDEVERILADYAELNPATEAGSTAAAQRRDELLARSGLLLARGPGKAGFYHFSLQEFLATEHLARTRREPDWVDAVVAARAQVREWRLTLGFLFGRMLERNGEQWALEAAERLLASQDRAAVRADPAAAVLCADWLEILQRKRLNLGQLRDRYASVTLEAIEDEIPLQDRLRLGLVLGLVGDPRPGVGVAEDSTPDIDWVAIPGGKVTLAGSAGKARVTPFQMSRYPATNAQFQAFVDATDGYAKPEWWKDMPEDADDGPAKSRWSEPNRPRETVSWYEAVAFCRWLSRRLGFAVRLPNEYEWQQAATGGDQNHVYPWGRDWDAQRCNTAESGLNSTTAVGLYPSGANAQGVLDLSGNLWEWCLNKYGTPGDTASDDSSDSRVLRGGSWYYFQDLARADSRYLSHPYLRFDYGGFRVVCASPIR